MPWFKKFLFGKKKNKKTKREISEPSSFQHCYHATFDNTSGEFVGLPPQWTSLVSCASERPTKSPSSSCTSSRSTVVIAGVQPPVVVPLEARTTVGFVEPTASSAVTTAGRESVERGNTIAGVCDRETTPATSDRSLNSSPVSADTSREESTNLNRPAPIIRGSDSCLEETIKYIRKHYRSASSASPAFDEEEQYVDIHFGSRSRSGSLMQLRGTAQANHNPTGSSPRPNADSYTSSSTNTMNKTSTGIPLASNSTFCLSAPHDLNVAQLDLGLYDCNPASASNTTLFRSRIHSPSESSGYFGSTMSSLCSSRISTLSSIPQIHQIPSSAGAAGQPVSSATTQQYRCSTLHEASESPWLHSQMRHGQPHFSSLQRPMKYGRTDSGSHPTAVPRAYAHGTTPGSNSIGLFAGSPPGHCGTTPRAYSHRPRGESIDNALISRSYRQHDPTRGQYSRGGVLPHNSSFPESQSNQHPSFHTVYSSSSSSSQQTCSPPRNTLQPVCKSRRQQQYQQQQQQQPQQRRTFMTSEQFRTTLELLVNRNDPRKDLCELAKVGEGSTGLVFLAQQLSTGRKVAVKKMNIRRQQRRELLFNEVSF